jgi:hypothetical protein
MLILFNQKRIFLGLLTISVAAPSALLKHFPGDLCMASD